MIRAQAQWMCRRSVRELDILFTYFFENFYDQLNEADQREFQHLLLKEDAEIMAMLRAPNLQESMLSKVLASMQGWAG
jgi:succinate dehydrogenase flavin-adding protein (antitoxin of CptAB toxin-antitoxin module)